MTNYPKICFDRILPQEMNLPRYLVPSTGQGPARAIIVHRKMWINGSTLRIRFLEGTAQQQQMVKDYAPQWTQHANLKFEFTNAPDADIRIAFNPNDGAWSYVGTDAKSISQNEPTMNLGWQDEAVILHEFGHAIGLGHEHQNPSGGIEWNEEIVIRDLGGPPNNWSEPQVRHNVLNKYSADQIRGTTFDRDSIMLYFFPDSWVLNGEGTKENSILSDIDKSFIAGAEAYPREANVTPVEIPVIESTGMSASIGQPGEEDLFTFTANSESRYTIETGGQTDVVMKLFGPDSQTALIGEDDDGGIGRNSKIIVNLTTGQYFVQIRHYNKTGGTGEYTIRVSK